MDDKYQIEQFEKMKEQNFYDENYDYYDESNKNGTLIKLSAASYEYDIYDIVVLLIVFVGLIGNSISFCLFSFTKLK